MKKRKKKTRKNMQPGKSSWKSKFFFEFTKALIAAILAFLFALLLFFISNHYSKDESKEVLPKIISLDSTITQDTAIRKSTFYISPNLIKLRNLIKDSTDLIYSLGKPTYSIEIVYSGEILQKSKRLFVYRGGYLVLKINNNVCYEFTEYKLTASEPHGNNKEYVNSELMEQINALISEHKLSIIKEIKSCLNM